MAAVNEHHGNTPAATPAPKQAVPSAKTVDTQSVLKRLLSDWTSWVLVIELGLIGLTDSISTICESFWLKNWHCLEWWVYGESRLLISPAYALSVAKSRSQFIKSTTFAWFINCFYQIHFKAFFNCFLASVLRLLVYNTGCNQSWWP